MKNTHPLPCHIVLAQTSEQSAYVFNQYISTKIVYRQVSSIDQRSTRENRIIEADLSASLFCQWLWLSWQSGRFRHQRSAVQIQSQAKFLLNIVNCQLCRKDENKEKEAGNGPFFKKTLKIPHMVFFTRKILLITFWNCT